jgi:hypothetical protein
MKPPHPHFMEQLLRYLGFVTAFFLLGWFLDGAADSSAGIYHYFARLDLYRLAARHASAGDAQTVRRAQVSSISNFYPRSPLFHSNRHAGRSACLYGARSSGRSAPIGSCDYGIGGSGRSGATRRSRQRVDLTE